MTSCAGAVPEARAHHALSWFFVEEPVSFAATDGDRWVQRGYLLHGGTSEATGAVLDDDWLFDLTHAGTGRCPWIALGSSGLPTSAAGLAWDPVAARFVLSGGYTDDGASVYATDGLHAVTVSELATGAGWTAIASLPALEYATSDLADLTPSNLGYYPSLDCAPTPRDVPCAVDPVWGRLLIAGGTTGCEGACSAWYDVEVLDGTAGESLALANADAVIELSGGAAGLLAYAGSVELPAGVPATTSTGRRGGAGAVSGPEWDHASHAFGGTASLVVVGGTAHHALGAGRLHVLRCETAGGDPADFCDLCLEATGTWEEAPPPHASDVAGLVSSWRTVSVFEEAALEWDAQGDPGSRVHAAATWMGGAQVLGWGGDAASGPRSDLFVWDTDIGDRVAFSPTEDWGGRVGGAAAYDPVTRTAMLLGGAADTGAYSYALEPLVADDNLVRTEGTLAGSAVTASALVATVAYDGSTWTLGGKYAFAVACDSGTACFADDAVFAVATESAAELATVTVSARYPDTGVSYDLAAHYTVGTGEGFTRVYARLPRIVTEGMAVEVEVGWEATVAGEDSFDGCLANRRRSSALCSYATGADDSSTADDERTTMVILAAMPVVPDTLRDATDLALTTTFSLPTGWQGVAPGAPDAALATFSGLSNLVARGEASRTKAILWASDGLDLATTLTSASGASLPVWIDQAVDVTGSAHGDFVGDGTLQADLDWLESTVASLPGWPVNLVLLARSTAEEVAYVDPAVAEGSEGLSVFGLAITWMADADGVPRYSARPTSLHELAHHLLTYRNQPNLETDEAANWWKEGVPRLLQWMRLGNQPLFSAAGARGDDMPYLAARGLAEATCLGVGGDLEANGGDDVVAYNYGAYTAMQLYWTYRAHGGSEPGFWSEVVSFHDTAERLDDGALATFLGGPLAEPTFYTEWVAAGREGTPLLALTRLEPDTSGCVDTGACEPVDVLARVEQVQVSQVSTLNGCAIDAPVFTDVPYFFYCAMLDLSAPRPFFECAASVATPPSGVPRTIATAADDFTLVMDPAATSDPFPVYLQLLSNDNLLPGWMPDAGYSFFSWYNFAYRHYLVCADVADPDCGGDADGDGWPLRTECNDGDFAFNPAASPAPLGEPDNNCDGW